MASLLLKDMNKRLGLSGLSCSSAAATSVITGRAIDRYSPHLRDPGRSTTSSRAQPASSDSDSLQQQQQHGKKKKKKKKSTSSAGAGTSTCTSTTRSSTSADRRRLVSPATSSRFLLNSSRLQSDDVNVAELAPSTFIDIFPAGGDVPLNEEVPVPVVHLLAESSSASSTSSDIVTAGTREEKAGGIMRSCSTRTTQDQQVVVLRVSLHCKGCAGKVKKHISKMEGVASFDIDIATKKVTVVGDVTPLGVLNSVSKVKPAQFWPPPQPPRASASF